MYPCQQPKPCPPPVRKICISKACYNSLVCKEGGLYALDKHVVQSNGCRLPFLKTLAFDLSSLDYKKSYELSLVPSVESEAVPCSPYQGHFTSNYLIKFFNFESDGNANIYLGLPDQSAVPLPIVWVRGPNEYKIKIGEGSLIIQLGSKGYFETFTPQVKALRKVWNALRITIENKSTGSTISLLNNIIDGKTIPSLVTKNAGGTLEESTFAFGDWSQDLDLYGTLFLDGALTNTSEVSFEFGRFVQAKLVAPWTDAELFAQLQASGTGLWTVCGTTYETSRLFKEMRATSAGGGLQVITPVERNSPTFALPQTPKTQTIILEDQLQTLLLPVTAEGDVIDVLNKGLLGVEVRSSIDEGTINDQSSFAIPADSVWYSVTFQSLGEGNYFVRH